MKRIYFINRLSRVIKKRGFINFLYTLFIKVYNSFFKDDSIIYSINLNDYKNLIKEKKIIQIIENSSIDKINSFDLDILFRLKGKESIKALLEKRFRKNALLWIIKINNKLAGFHWSIQGDTMKPYFFPLFKDDVHLFDGEIFSEFRGQGLNPYLISTILGELKKRKCSRVFIEVKVWNKANINSLKKTDFVFYTIARKKRFFGRTITVWKKSK